ncbi:piggyBac transposable element-derived protein 4-like [Centruroides sculpturatus]|uniref:piggyBac transposable element-derived protein 4-like n=1 Tax=Centruroides sculpturatus TaxID=218467 RepID=UPI000C6E537B|nr:piggyBac transposable element-derived protein 4-like [Centruroides sculpturatus]
MPKRKIDDSEIDLDLLNYVSSDESLRNSDSDDFSPSEWSASDSDSESDSVLHTGPSTSSGTTSITSSWTTSSTQSREEFDFTGDEGIKIPVNNPEEILEIFECIANEDIINHITAETNKHAEEVILQATQKGMKKRSRMNDWQSTTANEIRLLQGIFLLMSIVKKPDLQSYYCRKPLLNTPIFYETMTKDRFILLFKFLHFSSSNDKTDKLYKIRDLLNLYRNSFKSVYAPSKRISIDESLLLWKGRLGWRIYVPLERARFGIECFFLCETKTGYIYSFAMYTGKGTQFPITLTDVDPSKQCHSTNIVLSLMEDLLDKGYHLGVDNYYSSVYLFEYLVRHSTDVTGTVRKTRKELPQDVILSKLKKGETSVRYKDKLMMIKWKDTKVSFHF